MYGHLDLGRAVAEAQAHARRARPGPRPHARELDAPRVHTEAREGRDEPVALTAPAPSPARTLKRAAGGPRPRAPRRGTSPAGGAARACQEAIPARIRMATLRARHVDDDVVLSSITPDGPPRARRLGEGRMLERRRERCLGRAQVREDGVTRSSGLAQGLIQYPGTQQRSGLCLPVLRTARPRRGDRGSTAWCSVGSLLALLRGEGEPSREQRVVAALAPSLQHPCALDNGALRSLQGGAKPVAKCMQCS